MGLLLLGTGVAALFEGQAFWMVAHPEYWVHPAQTLICGAMLLRFWRRYRFGPARGVLFTLAVAVIAFVLWVAPQMFFGQAPRLEGFDPAYFGATGLPYWLNLAFRFLRLVLVVPLVEELFWRGFLLRWLIRDDFLQVPFGAFTWKSFGLVTLFFMLEHQRSDWPAAFLTGALFNVVAYRTRSLSSCVLVHAITNAMLGIYILWTRQWGFW
ncbi:MAG: CAAX prenyl protease-related protein [Verrucomicrobiota bacterium]|nr:CAAX prenyl protease-related protein [Verrucomicrobiota bacterium]